MFRACLCLSGLSASIVLLLASAAEAQLKPKEPAVVWYRSTEGCPDGDSFLASLGERASLVRLARAGDRVDFVVNLAQTAEGAHGRLERETDRGTVAIREVKDMSCERVAEVVALNLSLALEPAQGKLSTEEEQATGEVPGEPAAGEKPQRTETEDPALLPPNALPVGRAGKAQETAEAPRRPSSRQMSTSGTQRKQERSAAGAHTVRYRLGLQGGVLSGVATGLMGRGSLFAEVRGPIATVPDLAFRLSGSGATGSSETELGTIRQAIGAGRIEVCPLSFGGETLSLNPCASGELGWVQAVGPLRDSSLWWAVGGHLRAIWALNGPFAIETEVGANFPLSKYEILAGSRVLYHSGPVGISASLGASVGF